MASRVEFFFDCSSPWTYLAFHRIQLLAHELHFKIDWKPFLVGGVFNTVNDSIYKFRANPIPAKVNYLAKDLEDWSRYTGLKILWQPSVFPVNSVRAMRGCLVAGEHGLLPEFSRLVFESYWRDDLDIYQFRHLRKIAENTGLDPDGFLRQIESPSIKSQLKKNTEELIERGGFGTPTMFVDGDDMYFGNDRIPLIRELIE